MTDPATGQAGLLVYELFYGLREKPFSLSTDPRFFYQSASHTPVFHELLAGIRRREGLVVLTGEIGMGKTTLCRSVLAALEGRIFSAFVPDPFISREDLLKILLVEFGVVSKDDLMRGRLQGASRAELSYPLYGFLRSLDPPDAHAVLLIDEAQNVPAPLLEEVRILVDLESAHRLLQVVLTGQPELSSVLHGPHMRHIEQRVTTHGELLPLDRDGVHGYVGHRLTVAGASVDRLHFSVAALDLVFEASGGVPRVINRLCDRTLYHGHRARAAAIGADLVRAAMADLQLTLTAPEARVTLAEPAPPVAPHDPEPAVAAGAQVLWAAAPRARAAQRRMYREAPRESRMRGVVAAASLIVLGTLTGLTIAVYWIWAGPMLTQRVALPRVQRPSMRISAPLPAVLEPAIEAIGDAIAPPHMPESAGEPAPAEAGPPRAVTTAPAAQASKSVWVVQVGAFADDARATSQVAQLSARGFTAFKGASTMRNGAPMHLVIVGPYVTRRAAAAALDQIEQLPGAGRPILQVVPPAAAVH